MPTNAAADVRVANVAPIEVEVIVPCPPDRAFEYFAHDIHAWWPLASHSLGGDDAVQVHFEPRVGGRLVETLRDGSTHVWGTVTLWAPGERLAFTWHLDRAPGTAQLVDVRFVAQGASTRVMLTHSGWERRDDGDAARANYVGGWAFVLGERFGGYCTSRATG